MDLANVSQVVTLVLAVVALIWHQERSIGKVRDELNRAAAEYRSESRRENEKLRKDLTQAITEQRAESRRENEKLGKDIEQIATDIAANGQRLARIEGYLRIGIPASATTEAAGTAT